MRMRMVRIYEGYANLRICECAMGSPPAEGCPGRVGAGWVATDPFYPRVSVYIRKHPSDPCLSSAQFVLAFLDVLGPFFGHLDEDLERRFDDHVEHENEDVDAGEILGQPLARLDDRDVEEIGNKGE
jgi:hypothetical protein